MTKNRTDNYTIALAQMIQLETVSSANQSDKTKFYNFHSLLRELFPKLFSTAVCEEINGSLLLKLKG
ncbi:MAG: hypothetical protein IJY04_05535, partial [Clostridia bacterium]|nr:hypothetical protein [Clostridia bacterium]